MPLNGRFSTSHAGEAERTGALAALRQHNLDVREFVLFVSTIEPRKNHTLAFSTWSKMIKAGQNVPVLVCVGGAGWYNEALHETLKRDSSLAEKVLVLTDIPDQLLRLLYGRCLFTIYPSRYEGWGLPVSESIGYGKVPLVSRVASLPEAGGDLVEYFDLDSAADFQAKLTRLIYDEAYRKEKERKIAQAPNLQSWAEIGRKILDTVGSLDDAAVIRLPPAKMKCGVYHSFARIGAKRIADLRHAAEVYRDGLTWHSPEPFGCWLASSAEIAFSLADEPGNEFHVYLHLMGTNTDNTINICGVPNNGWSMKLAIEHSRPVWARVPIRFSSKPARREVRLRITADKHDDFALHSDGQDRRKAAVGVKGIYVCGTDDAQARLRILEAMSTGDFDGIARHQPNSILI